MQRIQFEVPQAFEVNSAQRKYPVEFFEGIDRVVEKIKSIKNPVFIIDANVRELYKNEFEKLLHNYPVLTIEATEDAKTFEGIGRIVNWLSENRVTKANHLVAIGGGIIQDVATFSSCIFFRGLPWTLVPTTLLSMSDSCIGAKCGINLNSLKNQLGVFNSPFAVWIAPAFLETLNPQDVKSGYGEILKLYLTDSYEKFLELERELGEKPLLSELTGKHIAESLKVKKRVIEEDEYEADLRRILNYGHTFGHALEAETNHFVPHGLGVAWGIDFVNFVAVRSSWLAEDKYRKIKNFVRNHLGFENSKTVTADGLLSASKRDKKMASASDINMIFFTNQDRLEIKKIRLDDTFKVNLENYVQREDVFRGN
jgi:3-dehydroquinate synthase